jgi:O-antigen/teichoic acid export membrane protein
MASADEAADGAPPPTVVATSGPRATTRGAAGPASRGRLVQGAAFAVATISFQGSRLFVNLVAAAVLGPAVFGTWVLITLVLQYALLLTVGIPNAAGRDIPLNLGAGDLADADAVEDLTVSATLVSALVGGVLGMLLAATFLGASADPTLVVLLGLAVASQHLFFAAQILSRSRFDFGAASVQLAVAGAVNLVAGLALLRAGLVGLTAAIAVAQLVAVAVTVIRRRRRLVLRWDAGRLRRLAAVGIPIMLAGFAFIVLTTVDRWLIAAVLGNEAVGIYGVAGIVTSGLILVGTILGQQFLPRLAFAHGRAVRGAALLAMAQRQGRIALLAVGLAAVAVVLAGWLAIPIVAPSYMDARLPMTILAAGVLAYAPASALGNLLNVTGHQRDYLAVQLISIVIVTALCAAALALGTGLVGVSLAVAVTMLVYALLLHLRAGAAVRSRDMPGNRTANSDQTGS